MAIKKRITNRGNEKGFMGLLMVLVVSMAIFTLLSTAHIYSVRHGKYQRQIREAAILQLETENFAMIIRSASENGRACDNTDCTSTCKGCWQGNTCFAGISCTNSSNDPKSYECIDSPNGRAYCLVKLEASSSASPPPAYSPQPTYANPADFTTCFDAGGPPHDACSSNAYLTSDCKNACAKHVGKDLSTKLGECCKAKKLEVLNCASHRPVTCDTNYKTLAPLERMACEICETDGSGGRLFTYYMCPSIDTKNANATLGNCVSKVNATPLGVGGGAYYQTFRLLTDGGP